MKRNLPSHMLVRYQALGCVADGRIELGKMEENIITAKVTSSDMNQTYTVSYRQVDHTLVSDDTFSLQNNELGYPALALLLFLDVLDYQDQYGSLLADISWKRMKNENDNGRDITQAQVDEKLKMLGYDLIPLYTYCDSLAEKFKSLDLGMLGEKQPPVI